MCMQTGDLALARGAGGTSPRRRRWLAFALAMLAGLAANATTVAILGLQRPGPGAKWSLAVDIVVAEVVGSWMLCLDAGDLLRSARSIRSAAPRRLVYLGSLLGLCALPLLVTILFRVLGPDGSLALLGLP
jgi:hypothetical protein